jgi:hypothetical protein
VQVQGPVQELAQARSGRRFVVHEQGGQGHAVLRRTNTVTSSCV